MVELTMAADAKQLAGAKADLSALLGDWVNAMPKTDYLTRIVVTEVDGELMVRPYGAPVAESGEPVDWGTAVGVPYVAGGKTEAAGFHATYEMGSVHIEIAANGKQGVLVIQSYTSFRDDSSRPSHFGREFFFRAEAGSGGTGFGSLAGDWVNTYTESEWIKEFTLSEEDGVMSLRVRGVSEPTDWGVASVTLYQDEAGQTGFHAVFDLDDFEAVLAANTNKGLLIIVALIRFKDGSRSSFLCREFFIRAVESGSA